MACSGVLDLSTLESWLWEAACVIRGPVDAPKFTGAHGALRRFDLVTAHPMWNRKSEAKTCEADTWGRSIRGIPPTSSADWGWIQHMAASLADTYPNWRAVDGLSALITTADAAKNDFNLSPSRYVSVGERAEVLPLDEAVVELREAEEEMEAADRELEKVLKRLGLA